MIEDNKLHNIRHSLAHLLAIAVLQKDPGAKLGIGPVIDNGFYYDFEFSKGYTPSPEDLKDFQKAMKKMTNKDTAFVGREVSVDEAKKMFVNQPYKTELIHEFEKETKTLTLYTTGDFTDLCKGGHIDSTKEIDPDSFAITHIAGAYWRGNEKNPMLTRIYGLAFENGADLDAYVKQQEEAKKRDHRKLGKELGLFTIVDEVGPGLPMFYPKGAILRRNIENYITEEQERRGYQPIWIPHITKGTLYEISGHLDKYDAMYTPMKIDENDYYVKPMSCPHFMMLYKSLPHSYKELPLRYTATGTVYRYEKSGELSGLTRVRSVTQDDCHVFCTEEQIEKEITIMLEMIGEVYKVFGMSDFYVRISLRDSKNKEGYLGSDEVWESAENALRNVVKATGWNYKEAENEAAFYGPKLDFVVKDAIGREWQLSTIQLDFNLPKRFELEYTSAEAKKETPVVIHRAILGSTERFLGIIIEHFAGNFPLWLSPVQVKVLPVSEHQADYAQKVYDELRAVGIRVELDDTNDSLGKRIREAKTQKTPYILVLGDKEKGAGTVTAERRGGDTGETHALEDFIKSALHDIKEKTIW